MSLDLKIKIDMGDAAPAVDKLDSGLQGVAASAAKAGAAGKAAGEEIADGMGSAAAGTKKTGDEFEGLANRQRSMLERIKGPWRDYSADINTAMTLLRQSKITTEEYGAELSRLQSIRDRLARNGMSPEFQRETEILTRINGPMREYEADLAALNALLEKGAVDMGTYERELEKVQQRASRGLGPVQGPVQQHATPGNHGEGAGEQIGGVLIKQFGTVGELIETVAKSGPLMFAGLAAGSVALTHELISQHDEWAKLQNSVLSYTEDGRTVNQVLEQQISMSRELHASLEATIELHSKLRDLTSELNLGSRRQAELAKEIGQAVVGTGGSAEQAQRLVQDLSLTLSTGVVHGRELNTVFKGFPEIADGITESTGKTRQELYALANTGQFSAAQLLSAFDKMAPRMEGRVKALNSTISGQMEHMYQDIKLGISNTINRVSDDAYDSAVGPNLPHAAEIRAQERFQKQKADVEKQIKQERERIEHISPLAATGGQLGISLGRLPKEQVEAADELRIRMREVGITIVDAFDAARSKAMLFSAELDQLKGSDDAKQIAIDVKRIYDAMYGADNKIQDQINLWHDLTDQVRIFTSVVSKLNPKSGILGGVADSFKFAGIPAEQLAQIRRESGLQLAQAKTADTDSQYGAGMVTYAQGINKARSELEALNRAHAAGVISGDAFRKQYDSIMTTLNSGALPSTIKLWEELHIPMQQFTLDAAAADTLLKNGTYTLQQYRIEMQKLAEAAGEGNQWKERQAVEDIIDGTAAQGRKRYGPNGQAVSWLNQAQGASEESAYKQTSDAAVVYAQRLREIAATQQDLGLGTSAVVALQDQAREQFDSAAQAVTRVSVSVAGYQEQLARLGASGLNPQQLESSIAQLDRERQIVAQFAQPAATYKRALEDIAGAQRDLSLTETQSSVLRRKAKDEYTAATEALQKQRGPLQEYEAALRKINEQLGDGYISQRRADDEMIKARIAYIQASDAGRTFSGAFEQSMLELKESTKDVGSSIAKLATDDIGKLTDSFVDAANGGQVSFSAMAESMLADLEKVLIKALAVQAITSLFGAFGGGGGGLSLTSLVPALGNLPGHAAGASWLVGGAGGSDTHLQAFMASAGERVTVTPGEYQHGLPGWPGGGGGGAAVTPQPIVNVINHVDKSVALAAIDSRQGSKTIVNQMRANSGAMRSYLGIRR